MTGTGALGPAEILVLLDPRRARANAALRLTIFALIGWGRLKVGERSWTGLLGRRRRETTLRIVPGREGLPPGPAGAVAQAFHALGPEGAGMRRVIEMLRRRFDDGFKRFLAEDVKPVLTRRGLLEERREKILGLFPVTRLRHTPRGEAERARYGALLEKGRHIPKLLERDPAQAVALAAALGAAIVILDELRPHLAELAGLMRQSGWEFEAEIELEGGGLSLDGLEGFDAGAFDGLDAALSDIDSSLDGGGDGGGGDGGGGDGGGGGD